MRYMWKWELIIVVILMMDNDILIMNVTFTGPNVQGNQHLLVVEDYNCQDGCFPKVTGFKTFADDDGTVEHHIHADYNSYECGRRGKCDYDSGICQCFEGFTG